MLPSSRVSSTRQVSTCTVVSDKYSHRGVPSLIDRSRQDGRTTPYCHQDLQRADKRYDGALIRRVRLHKIIDSQAAANEILVWPSYILAISRHPAIRHSLIPTENEPNPVSHNTTTLKKVSATHAPTE